MCTVLFRKRLAVSLMRAPMLQFNVTVRMLQSDPCPSSPQRNSLTIYSGSRSWTKVVFDIQSDKRIYSLIFFGLTFGDAATSVKDARALWLCPMKEYFKIMLKQKKQFPSSFDHSQSARAFLEGPQSRTSIQKNQTIHTPTTFAA